MLARNSSGSLDGYSDGGGSSIANGVDAATYSSSNHTLTRRSRAAQLQQQQQQQHPQPPMTATVGRRRSGQRLSRTNSADGRLTDLMLGEGGGGGSITWEVAPWAQQPAPQTPAQTPPQRRNDAL